MGRTFDLPVGVASKLLGPWELESLQERGGPPVLVSDSARVTADFRPDGRLQARAGYNQYNAIYRVDDGALTLATRSTLMSRGAPPLDLKYITLLEIATRWRSTVEGASLELRSDAGTLRFRR